VVACSQAFHWFRPAEALAECARVLRPGGRVALMWNDRDIEAPAGAEYERLTQQASTAPRSVSWTGHQRPLRESMLFTNFREHVYASEQRLTLDGLIGRALSASYVPTSGPAHDVLIQGLTEMHRRHADGAGVVALPQRTSVYLAEKR
jgi:SAM-dependent methyltransferase